MRLLDECESPHLYGEAIVLATAAAAAPAGELIADLRTAIPRVELLTLEVRDPSDYAELFHALEPAVDRIARAADVDILLSAGTPQMQTLWLILTKAGLLSGRLLQVIPAAFVPSIHPKAIREVHLDIDGFPEIRAIRDEVVRLRAHSRVLGSHLIGGSRPMRDLANRIGRVAPTTLPVLIHGETGTGKELVARSVHDSSHRASGPLITENCGALTESVLASELFGHEKGAFTGAAHAKRGLFELAHGGTLFLDEIGELSPKVQVNLLRVLENGTLRRLGGETSIRVDVRIVAATHRDLPAMVRDGTFREDLYYRLQGATLAVPPLRDRIEDLEPLVSHFLAEVGGDLRVSREAWRALESYSWPGNVRELRAEVMRWHVFCDRWVRPEDLDPKTTTPAEPAAAVPSLASAPRPLAEAVAEAERAAVSAALAESGGNLSRAARILAIDRNTLKRKVRRHQIACVPRSGGRPVGA
jgi:transcriptional regulator with GAF, ATPase, and Fis domain